MTSRAPQNLVPVILLVLAPFLVGCPGSLTTVPNVAGMAQDAASAAIIGADLVVGTVTHAYSTTVAAGSVISQTPSGGSSAAPGTAVLLTLSQGPPPVAVPDVTGQSLSSAQLVVAGANLAVGEIIRQFSVTVTAGSVISQDPAAGANVPPGTAVNLIVSKGPPGEGEGTGSVWVEAAEHAGWSSRVTTTAVFDGKLWVLGGNGPTENGWKVSNDVWWSSDGATWIQAAEHAGWSPRITTAAVFDNRLWVLGGANGNVLSAKTAFFNDVWWSLDGVTWTQATGQAGWSARGTAAVVFDGKLWVLGGLSQGLATSNDVWWSSDGALWTQATEHAEWSARGAPSVVFDDKLWILGGMGSGGSSFKNDVWWSPDGATWTRATADADWPARAGHTTAAFDNRLWILGGMAGSGISTTRNDVWWSLDGTAWTRAAMNASWSARWFHAAAAFDNRLWVLGGTGTLSGSTADNDVWHTADN